VIHQIGGLAETTCAADGLLGRCAELGSSTTRRFVDGLGRTAHRNANARPSRTLVLAHDDLTLGCRDFDDSVALGVETSRGWVEELRMARLAQDAMEFCSRTATFRVDELPGRLTREERLAVAEALEESGLFTIRAVYMEASW
jgi:hypothetical protein